MANGKYNVNRRIDTLARQILEGNGENSIVFLDTGAVIDFEYEIKRKAKLTDSTLTPEKFYRALLDKLPPVFVNEDVYDETLFHFKLHALNGRPEISCETMRVISGLHHDYCRFLKHIEGEAFEMDKIRLDVYWAAREAFPIESKKLNRDPISRTDQQLLSDALWARYTTSFGFSGIHDSKPISSSVIISPDAHISGTIFKLHNEDYGYSGLKAVSSR